MMMGVYQIKCVVTGEFYIGVSMDIEHRWKAHRYDLHSNKHINPKLQEAWNIYGEANFEFTILEGVYVPNRGDSNWGAIRSRMIVKESYYIHKLRPVYNRTPKRYYY